MLNIRSTRDKSGYDIKYMSIIVIILLTFSFLLSVLLADYWVKYTAVFHTVVESICIFIALSSFFMVLFTYGKTDITSCAIIGSGILCSAIYNVFHISYYLLLQHLSRENHDLPLKYWALGRFTVVVLILSCILPVLKRKVDKWIGTITVIILASGVSFFIMYMPELFPVQITSKGITTPKMLIGCLMILVFIVDICLLIENRSDLQKGIIAYEYIILSILFIIPTEILFASFRGISSYYAAFGHILKVVYYCLIFRGIYISIIEYPYSRLEENNRYISDILNHSQTILNSMANFALLIDKEEKIIMCNKAFQKVSGMSDKDVVGMSLDDYRKKVEFEVKAVLQEDADFSVYEASIVSAGGEKKDIILNSSNIYNADKDFIGYIHISSDITAYREEEEKFQHQEKLALIGQIASGIVHEIKNPLSVIKGTSQLIQVKYEDKALRQYARTIDESANNINKFIVGILDLSKPHPAEIRDLSLNSIIKEVSLIIRDYLSIKNITVNTVLCEEERIVVGDADKIKQVLLNIINNAVDAVSSKQNPEISIITNHDDIKGSMIIKVIDNGKGISADDIKKIGTPFFTTKENGTGLGLSICYQLINQHGGQIKIESEEGKGSCFIISIPCKSTAVLTSDTEGYDDATKVL